MKRDWALLAGWAAGVFSAASVALVVLFLEYGGARGGLGGGEVLGGLLMATTLMAGPGLLLLSGGFSVWFKRRLRQGSTRGSMLALGALVGSLLGPPAAVLFPVLLYGPSVLEDVLRPDRPESLVVIAMGVVGGACCGLACAWRTGRSAKEVA